MLAPWLKKMLTQPTNSVPNAGKAVANLSRNASYAAAARGDIPTIKIGRKLAVPTVWIKSQLMLDDKKLG